MTKEEVQRFVPGDLFENTLVVCRQTGCTHRVMWRHMLRIFGPCIVQI